METLKLSHIFPVIHPATLEVWDFLLKNVKYQKNSETGLLNNHISEHLGSNIFRIIGENAQQTTLGTYKGREIVLCKDFIQKD